MVNRYSSRVPVGCSVVFAGDGMVGEGRALDVSIPGCLLESPQTTRAGDYVQLRLFLPDNQPPLSVQLAVVRWVEGSRFGVEFIRSSSQDQVRLANFVRSRLDTERSGARWKEGIVLLGAAGE